MSAFTDAYTEVFRAVQPDVEPKLEHGDGLTPDSEMEFDAIILASARGVTWEASLNVTYGQRVFPATRMGRIFKVTKGGTLGTTEPDWPDYDYASVTDGTATLVEDGIDFDSIYDLRKAKYDAWDLKTSKATDKDQFLQDARGQASTYLYLNCVRERDKFRPLGVA